MALTTDEVANALIDWVTTVCPEIIGTYDFPANQKTQSLPDVAAEIVEVGIGTPPELSRHFGIEQITLKTYTFNILLMVSPEPADVASDLLTDMADRLLASLVADGTLGSRVPGASPASRITFQPPFVEFDDGTRGRLCTMSITVGEPIDVE